MNAGINIPSADLYYRLVEFYSLSTINSSLNIKNCIVFFNTLIINFHIYTIIYITRKYVMNQTNIHNNSGYVCVCVCVCVRASRVSRGEILASG